MVLMSNIVRNKMSPTVERLTEWGKQNKQSILNYRHKHIIDHYN